MSRYSKIIQRDNKNIEVAWGYDEPLREYFLQEFHDEDDLEDEEEETIFSISNVHTIAFHPKYPGKFRYSNSEILKLMEEYDEDVIPKEHKQAVAMDLPF